MDEDLTRKLLADIGQTGFPSELRARAALEAAGWLVSGNSYYVDEDEGKGREFDLSAHCSSQTEDDSDPRVSVWTTLAVEVKKSARPWVVFTSARRQERGDGYAMLHCAHNVGKDLLPYTKLSARHPAHSHSRLGRSAHVGFRGDSGQVFGAIVSASKAAYAMQKEAAGYGGEVWNEVSADIAFYTPVVVLDGRLFDSHLNDADALALDEVPWLTYSLHYLSPHYAERTYLVDVVTLDELAGYASRHREWVDDMRATIESKVRG